MEAQQAALDRAIMAHREAPTAETRAALLAAQGAVNEAFQRAQTEDFQRRTRGT